MLRGERNRQWSRSSTFSEERAGPGFEPMPLGEPRIASSRFHVLSSTQRTKPPQKTPPEPLRRAVASCLSATHYHPNSEAVRTLQDYLSNPSSVDLAYSVLLEHANAERDRSPPVVARCVSLLKRYLVRYVPKHAMLQQVDAFCAVLIAECNSAFKPPIGIQGTNDATRQGENTLKGITKATFASGTLVKSLTYVRALVARHLPSNLQQSTRTAEISSAHLKRTRPFHTPYGSSVSRGLSDGKDVKPSSMHGIGDNDDYLATDVLWWRWLGGKRQQCWAPSPVMTDSGGISRPQVKRLYEFSNMGVGMLFLRNQDLKVQRQHGKLGGKKSSSDSFNDQLLEPSKVTTVTDGSSTRSHLRAITALKRQKLQSNQVWDSGVPKSTWRRRPRPLFQYKHYSEQQPLRLNMVEIEEVISAFCVEGTVTVSTPGAVASPAVQSGRLSVETADVAGSVLIKLIIDMYMADPTAASPLTFAMLESMLSSSTVAVRTRCFDLLLNLGIHAHLLEPMQMEEQSVLEEEEIETSSQLGGVTPFLSSKRGLNLEEAFRAEERLESMRPQEESDAYKAPSKKVDSGTPEAVKSFEFWLLQILFEMLLFLVQIQETDEAVWAAALSCLLYFVCDSGRILRHRLCGVDIRVLKCLLGISWENAWAEEVHSTLLCMLTNLLYRMDGVTDMRIGKIANFDSEQLELLGGIEFICTEYTRAKSVEAKLNLFSVVLDYVLHELNNKIHLSGKPGLAVDDIQAVVAALSLADAAEVLGFALKHGLKSVGQGLFKSITGAMSRDVESGRLNEQLLEEVTSLLDTVVASHCNPDEEFSDLISVTMTSKENSSTHDDGGMECSDESYVSQAWSTLRALLHSSDSICRILGQSWLADLLTFELTQGGLGIQNPGLQQMVNLNSSSSDSAVQIFYGLLKSRHAAIRRSFILVLERLLVKCQQFATNVVKEQVLETEAKQDDYKGLSTEKWENAILDLMNTALRQFVSDKSHINILQMCDLMFSELCIVFPSPSSPGNTSHTFVRDNMVYNRFGSRSNIFETGKCDSKQIRQEEKDFLGLTSNTKCNQMPNSTSLATMLLRGQAAVPKVLLANIPTDTLYLPLWQLAGAATEDMALGIAVGSQGNGSTAGGASDVRAALLVLLIGKCSIQQSAFEEVGGEEFFRSLLDDMDARVAYYTASFLLKRMMSEEPEKYQQVLHTLVFRAQQCNNEKLLENPYLQMRGILQLSSDLGNSFSFQES